MDVEDGFCVRQARQAGIAGLPHHLPGRPLWHLTGKIFIYKSVV